MPSTPPRRIVVLMPTVQLGASLTPIGSNEPWVE
jgi:hypothetical protein